MPIAEVNMTTLFYTEQGSGTPILLIHGTGMNADMWGAVVPDLAVQHRVIAYDRQGHSRSPAPPIKEYHQHGEDAAALLSFLHTSSAMVIGWSAGGIVALDLALHHPHLVQSLVLIEPPLHAKNHPDVALVFTLLKVQLQRLVIGHRRAATTFLRYALSSTTGDSAFDRWPVAWQQAMGDNAAAVLAELDAGTGEELQPARLATITCPVTCLRGALSQPFLVKSTERLTQLLPQAAYDIVPNVAHGLPVDKRAEFVAIIERGMLQDA
jgi:pimeloyl-ACP methyl ester carboxylesterase